MDLRQLKRVIWLHAQVNMRIMTCMHAGTQCRCPATCCSLLTMRDLAQPKEVPVGLRHPPRKGHEQGKDGQVFRALRLVVQDMFLRV